MSFSKNFNPNSTCLFLQTNDTLFKLNIFQNKVPKLQECLIISVLILLFSILCVKLLSAQFKSAKYPELLKVLKPSRSIALPGPKPFPWRLIGNVFQLSRARDIVQMCFDWSKKHGSCFVFTVLYKDFVVISNAELAKCVLHSDEIGHLKKTDVYQFLKGIAGLAFEHGSYWREMRKNISKVFTYSNIQTKLDIYNNHADILLTTLSKLTQSGEKLVELEIANCSVQMIVEAFISQPNACTYGESRDYVKNWKRFTEITAHRIMHPWLGLDLFWKRNARYAELNQSLNHVHQFAEKLIKRHIKYYKNSANDKETNMISELLKLNYSFDQIKDEVVSLLLAHETNSLGLYYLLYMLAAHPEHQTKCQEEVDQLFNGRTNFYVSQNDLSQLKYLERCLLEAMRLFPPVFLFGRQLETELTLSNGVTLPTGTACLILPVVIQRMAEYYDNPEVFNPDNFLPEKTRKRPSCAYLPFAAGPRICLGVKTSIANIKIATAKILQKFVISTPVKMKDVKFKVNLTAATEQDLDLQFLARK